jgi:hypothetical protein
MNAVSAFTYEVAPLSLDWRTPAETAKSRKGRCVDFALYVLDAVSRANPEAKLRLIVGDAPQAGRHAWIEMDEGETVTWADPTWGEVHEREWWDVRTPLWAYEWDGRGFGQKYEYVEAGK